MGDMDWSSMLPWLWLVVNLVRAGFILAAVFLAFTSMSDHDDTNRLLFAIFLLLLMK
jgi:hypothetical protein